MKNNVHRGQSISLTAEIMAAYGIWDGKISTVIAYIDEILGKKEELANAA